MSKTDKTKYLNQSFAKGLKVLEALEGTHFEPVKIKKIEQRTGFTYDFCRRILITLEIEGYAIENERDEWTISKRLIRFAQAISKHEE